MGPGRKRAFWLGFSLALGLMAAVATVAVERSGSTPRSSPAQGPAQSLGASLSVFQRARAAADILPPAVATDFEAMHGGAPRAEVDPGAPLLDQSRLLLSDVGDWGGSLYAVPTTNGQVCEVMTGANDGCLDAGSLAAHDGVDWSLVVRGRVGVDPVKSWGIVSNDVTGITVVDDKGGRTPATLSDNAYFAELPRGDLKAVSLEVRYRNGSTAVIPLPAIGSPPSR